MAFGLVVGRLGIALVARWDNYILGQAPVLRGKKTDSAFVMELPGNGLHATLKDFNDLALWPALTIPARLTYQGTVTMHEL